MFLEGQIRYYIYGRLGCNVKEIVTVVTRFVDVEGNYLVIGETRWNSNGHSVSTKVVSKKDMSKYVDGQVTVCSFVNNP